MRALAPATVLVDGLKGTRVVHDVPGGAAEFVLPPADSPYGPNGCLRNAGFALELSVSRTGEAEPVGGASLSCGTSDGSDCGARVELYAGFGASNKDGHACLLWTDVFSGEIGYRVEVTYYRMHHAFVYFVPADSTVFELPAQGAPRLEESVERCLQRKDVTLSVFALFAGKPDEPAGATSIISECGH